MNIYQSCYDLIHQYVYGNVDLTANADLVCTLIATIACVFLVSIPFILVYKFVTSIT